MLSQRDHRGREIYVFRLGNNNSDYRSNDVFGKWCNFDVGYKNYKTCRNETFGNVLVHLRTKRSNETRLIFTFHAVRCFLH